MCILLGLPALGSMPLDFEPHSAHRVSPATICSFVLITVPARLHLKELITALLQFSARLGNSVNIGIGIEYECIANTIMNLVGQVCRLSTRKTSDPFREFLLEAVEALECVFLGFWREFPVLELLLNAAHRRSEASLAVAAEDAPSLCQPAPAKSANGDPDLLRREVRGSFRIWLLGFDRCRDVGDRYLILGCRLLVAYVVIVIVVVIVILIEVLIRHEFLVIGRRAVLLRGPAILGYGLLGGVIQDGGLLLAGRRFPCGGFPRCRFPGCRFSVVSFRGCGFRGYRLSLTRRGGRLAKPVYPLRCDQVAPGTAVRLALLAGQRQLEILQPDQRRPGRTVVVVWHEGCPVREALQALPKVSRRPAGWPVARFRQVRTAHTVLAARRWRLALLCAFL